MSDAGQESTVARCGVRPIYLLADSQLLFWKRDGRLLLEATVRGLARDTPLRAAYIGASNGDRPEFYEIFEAAMDAVEITNRRMIDSSFGPADRAFLETARLIVLGGGDVRLGWTTFEKSGMKDAILGRYADGAILVGISAGAVLLGEYGIVETPHSSATELLEVFKLVPAVVGLGIPSGSGVIVHPDRTIEPLRRSAHRFRFQGARVTHSLLSTEGPVPQRL